ncbi:hypothetical protein DLR11_11060 [Salmonella enterica subsp. salamae]|nr:hypothetical protein [Salmonella enterica subsp. salamae]
MAAESYPAWRVYSQKIGRQWRRQIIHGLRAVTGAYTEPGIKLASKLARNPAQKKASTRLAKVILEAM